MSSKDINPMEIGWRKELLNESHEIDNGSVDDNQKRYKDQDSVCTENNEKKPTSSVSSIPSIDPSRSVRICLVSNRRSSSISSSSSSSSSSNASSEDEKKKRKKEKQKRREEKKKKKEDKKKKKAEKRELKRLRKDKRREEKRLKKIAKKNKRDKSDDAIPQNLTDNFEVPIELMNYKAKAPETPEEYQARQNQIRRVVDTESGRTRLIKGNGEILEEIVSRDRHKEINRQATLGDGQYFQSKTIGWKN